MSDINNSAYTHRWVRAKMADIKEKKNVKHQIGTKKVTKTRGLFKKEDFEVEEPVYEVREEWVSTGKKSDTCIDIEDFSKRITDACNSLDAEGYDVLSIISTVDGRYSFNTNAGVMGQGGYGWGYGYGYSVTDGVVIIARLRRSNLGGN
ncbi:MAG: hypothetical protein D9V46_01560 [Deltaproteobacteria bacterium]|uniref:hypothetical protein n=1 Tax=Hydrosulfovibrio ferrireducens TaxID=2934181 RepID=UPI0012012628|nr:MAG: hypothetical protein D9V46_01560 [Deltaproteobacteria bacterium]